MTRDVSRIFNDFRQMTSMTNMTSFLHNNLFGSASAMSLMLADLKGASGHLCRTGRAYLFQVRGVKFYHGKILWENQNEN